MADDDFVTWGTQVRSESGLVGAVEEKRAAMAPILWQAASLERIPVKLMQGILGLLPHPMMHRREVASGLHRIYKRLAGATDGILRVTHDVKDELVLCGLLLAVSVSNVRWPVSSIVTCSDATPDSQAVCSANVHSSLATALYKSTEYK